MLLWSLRDISVRFGPYLGKRSLIWGFAWSVVSMRCVHMGVFVFPLKIADLVFAKFAVEIVYVSHACGKKMLCSEGSSFKCK